MPEDSCQASNRDAYLRALATPLTPQGPIRALAIGQMDGDANTDLVLSSASADDRAHVYEVVGDPIQYRWRQPADLTR